MTELVAFAGSTRVATGSPVDVLGVLRALTKEGLDQPPLIFDVNTGRRVEIDLRLSDAELSAQFVDGSTGAASRGRPKLGVVPREVTLLPRQWDWLGTQRGGASAALRRLVDEVRRDSTEADARRAAQEAVHHFITILAGDAPGYEEAVRALFAGDRATFEQLLSGWPADVRGQALAMAAQAFPAKSPLAGLVAADRLDAATEALRRVFGQEQVSAEPLAGRSGATILKISGATRRAVLRLDVPADGFRDPARHYACHAIAAQAGIAPALLHVDLTKRIAVSAFVDGSDTMARDERLAAVGRSLARLHAAPQFPPLMPFMQAMEGLIAGFFELGVLPKPMMAEIDVLFRTLRSAYRPPTCGVVASHNDLNPTNILFADGEAIFIDWETAFAADRYVDLAAVVNFLAKADGDEQLVLAAYFGRAPSSEELKRLKLMRQVSRLYYGIMLLRAARGSQPDLRIKDWSLGPESLNADAAAAAEPSLEVRLGCTFLAEALRVGVPGIKR